MTAVERLGQAYELYRRTATSRSAMLLLAANLVPLVGVVFFGWSLLTILVLYWIENGIVGIWNVPKIILARGTIIPQIPDLPNSAALAATGSPAAAQALQERWRAAQAARAALLDQAARQVARAEPSTAGVESQPAASSPTIALTTAQGTRILGPQATARLSAIPRTGLAIFFAFHYGMFWLVHGIFVFSLPAFAGGGFAAPATCLDETGFPGACPASAFGDVLWPSVVIGAIALFVSHGASFLLNYIGRGEYLTASPTRQMGAPYGRVFVLHATIIFGSIVVAFLGSPLGALLVLVTLKAAFDLGLHLRERRRAGPVLPSRTAATAA